MNDNLKVEYVRFHNAVYIPGVGECGNQLPSISKVFKDLTLEDNGAGVLISIKGSSGKNVLALVPYPNISVMVYAK